ncbi:MAG: M20/M25/M40 family metallo-hydrolase [Betaproteobacteria bacterium]|nr:MAG: M20/M25/M40 family metallo-hydrolase [Betaproteobacteria bacterium]
MNISEFWQDAIVPALVEYIRIPAKSPHFDRDWQAHGYIDEAARLAARWCEENAIAGMKLEIVRLEGRTPCLFIDVPGTSAGKDPVLIYGHLDKQPEMTGWREGLGPWTPVIEEGKLYGRGGADDGYAVFCAIAALKQLHADKRPHRRCVILIECCEESGSFDLPAYLESLAPQIGTPSFVVGLDSGCGNYSQLWGTASLRGLVNGVLTVEVLTEGVHSGDASGVVASSFRIARALLERLDSAQTGVVSDRALQAEIPAERKTQAQRAAQVLGEEIWRKFPFVDGMRAMHGDVAELILNRTWRPMLAVTGADGLPAPANAGNVLRPKTQLVLSLRLPPTLHAERAAQRVKQLLEADPPYGARVRFAYGQAATGWNAPATAPWLERAVSQASQQHYGQPAMWMGEGGTIPFMAMLGEKFPQAQFLITGVLGPHSNAHGPNEFLHLAYAKKLTACVADVLTAHAAS